MDINRLRYFQVVSQTENLHQAAELLGLSPPALSKAMKVLQQELGQTLLQNEGRGICLTEAGHRIAGQLDEIIERIDRLSVPEVAGYDRTLRIGTFEVFSTYFMGEASKDYFDGIRFELHELIPGQIESAISEGRVDLGITYIPVPKAGIEFLPVSSVSMDIYGLKGCFKGVEFNNLPFATPIGPVDGSPDRVRGLDGWPDHEFPRFHKYKVTMMESALEFCRQGLAVGVFPKFVVNLHNHKVKANLKLHPVSVSVPWKIPPQKVYLVKRKSSEEDKVAKKLAKALRMLCKG